MMVPFIPSLPCSLPHCELWLYRRRPMPRGERKVARRMDISARQGGCHSDSIMIFSPLSRIKFASFPYQMNGSRFPSNIQNSPRRVPCRDGCGHLLDGRGGRHVAGVDCACLDDFGQYWRSSGGGTVRSEISDPPNGVSHLYFTFQLGTFISNST